MTDNEKTSATDNEIIKALNRWTNNFEGKVTELAILCNALDLIKRQKEQIVALIAGQETLQKYIAEKEAEIELYRKDQDKLIMERDELKAEIERLKVCPKCVYEYDGEMTEYCSQSPCPNFKTVDEIKSEAVKEFAKRLKSEIVNKPSMFKATKATVDFLNGLTHRQHKILDDIDNLVKEMVGEG